MDANLKNQSLPASLPNEDEIDKHFIILSLLSNFSPCKLVTFSKAK